MKQINYKKLPSSLFDLPTDIISKMPTDLIKSWVNSNQSKNTAIKILKPTIVQGISVSSDSAGLSKLSGQKSVIEVLALVSKPKEFVYAFGSTLGGVGVGIWAADNTQMFYDKSIDPDEVIRMLIALQQKISSCEVKIGIGAHKGTFYHIGGGLYGNEADFIESVAEEETAAGEIVISQSFKRMIKDKKLVFKYRQGLIEYPEKIYRVGSLSKINFDYQEKYDYPLPYSHDFFRDIRKYYQSREKSLLSALERKYILNKTVVLIERSQIVSKISELNILNNFSLHLIMQKTSIDLIKKYHGQEIKTAGPLGIYVFDNEQDAYNFSLAILKQLSLQGIDSKIGIDSGEVLIFNLKNKIKDIAGSPVNIASKISQDTGKMGYIYLSENVVKKITSQQFKSKKISISSIELPVYYRKV